MSWPSESVESDSMVAHLACRIAVFRMLYEYARSKGSAVKTTYLVSGLRREGDHDEHFVALVPADKLEGTRSFHRRGGWKGRGIRWWSSRMSNGFGG